MNTATTNQGFNFRSDGTSGNAVAFLFGAIFNILANTNSADIANYSIKAIIGGVIMMLFKLLGDYISKRLFPTNTIEKGKGHSNPKKSVKRKYGKR